jgi:3-oxoacyl-[acyl-carrier protein] reductase
MNLGISGRKALVCGASKGLGYACAESLLAAGCDVTLVARTEATLQTAHARLAAVASARVTYVVADVTQADGRRAALATCPDPDIVITNAAGPPPGDVRSFSEADWQKALNDNMLAPLALINATIDRMIERRFGRIVNITSGMVKQASETLPLSNGARAGLTGAVAGLARQASRHNVTINQLLPGLFDTDRGRSVVTALARKEAIDEASALAKRLAGIPAGRMGEANEFGDFCAFICSAQAGYITGQNLLIDGGAFAGIF